LPRAGGGSSWASAPNKTVMGQLRGLLGDTYVSAGLRGWSHAVEALFTDISDVKHPERSFDVIIYGDRVRMASTFSR